MTGEDPRWDRGEPDEATVKAWLVEHISDNRKMPRPRMVLLKSLEDTYPYLKPPDAVQVYRGLRNLDPDALAKWPPTSDAVLDKSWSLTSAVAEKFARCEWTIVEPEADKTGAVLTAKADATMLLLNPALLASTPGIGDVVHPIWGEPLAKALMDEMEVLALGSMPIVDVSPVKMRDDARADARTRTDASTIRWWERQDFGPESICVVLPVPTEIAAQFAIDDPHITLAYMSAGSEADLQTVTSVVADMLPAMMGEVVTLGELDHFPGKRVAYATIDVSEAVRSAQVELVAGLAAGGLTVKSHGGDWVPHATLAYLPPGDDYTGAVPTGAWPIDTIHVWRGGACVVVEGRSEAERDDAKQPDDVGFAWATEVERQWLIVAFGTFVNMTPSEIKRWRKSPFADSGGGDNGAADQLLALSEKDIVAWEDTDFAAAAGLVQQISQLLDTEELGDVYEDGPSKRDAALMDLGHDPSVDDRADGARLDALGQWEWRTQGDGKVRAEHAALHGVRFDLDVEHPNEGQPGGKPGCRCYPVIVPKRGTAREARAIERASRYAQAYALTRWASEDRADRSASRAPAVHTESRNAAEEWRSDAAQVLPPEELPNGWKRYPVLYCKAGNIQDYPHLGITEFRPHDAVFDPWSLAMYAGLPWELLHSPALLTRQTVKGVARGTTLSAEPYTDGTHVFGYAVAWDEGLIRGIDSGDVVEQSLAFRVRTVRGEGTTDDGKRFNSRVIKVIPNSLAAVPRGRAETTRVLTDRLDSASGVTVHTPAELLNIAKRGAQSTFPIFFDLRSWHLRADAVEPQQTDRHQDAAPMKLIELMLAKAGKSLAELAAALGVAEADLAKAIEDPDVQPKIVEFLQPKMTEVEAVQNAGTGKIKIGDKEYEVDPAVAGHIAKLEEQVSMQAGRADRADSARVKAEAELKTRQDAMSDMVSRQDAAKLAVDQALANGRVLALHERIFGQKEPEARQDAAGAALPIEIVDYKRNIITGVYGAKAPEILARLDAKDEAIRNELLDDRMIDAAEVWAASRHTSSQQVASIARMRAKGANDRADAAPVDPLVEAKARQQDPNHVVSQGA